MDEVFDLRVKVRALTRELEQTAKEIAQLKASLQEAIEQRDMFKMLNKFNGEAATALHSGRVSRENSRNPQVVPEARYFDRQSGEFSMTKIGEIMQEKPELGRRLLRQYLPELADRIQDWPEHTLSWC